MIIEDLKNALKIISQGEEEGESWGLEKGLGGEWIPKEDIDQIVHLTSGMLGTRPTFAERMKLLHPTILSFPGQTCFRSTKVVFDEVQAVRV